MVFNTKRSYYAPCAELNGNGTGDLLIDTHSDAVDVLQKVH